MLRELLDRVVELGRESQQVEAVRPPAEPPHVYLLPGPGGTWERHEAEPPPRNHQCADLASLVRFALDFCGDGDPDAQEVEIWYSRRGVVCFIDADTRRDRVCVPVALSAPMASVCERQGKMMEHKAFVRFLRIELGGAAPPQLTESVRRLQFRAEESGESAVAHGGASIGRSIRAELQGEGAIPESVTLFLRGFEGHRSEYPVEFAVEVDAAARKLALTAMPGEVERALREAEDGLGRTLARLLRDGRGVEDGDGEYEEPVKLFCGVP